MGNKPEIVLANEYAGYHNNREQETLNRLGKAKNYQDQSTICLMPTPTGYIHNKVVQSMMSLMAPMNQKFTRIFMSNMEVGRAYSETIEMILNHPDLSTWKYILTWEWDNLAPPDGLLKLLENTDKYDIIGGLYFTKGEAGQPMCYGNPIEFPVNFKPFLPLNDEITPCRGTAMGFTLYKMDVFRDPKIPRPFFKTLQEYDPSVGAKAYTQDLYFAENAGKAGWKQAIDGRVKVGHMSMDGSDFVW